MTPHMRRAALAGVPLLALTAAFLHQRGRTGEPPEGLEVMEGLDATVFAEAPMLTNPTNLDVDARGRVWVLEGFNYRTTLHPENPVRAEGDRILILEDTDGDGRADSEKVFYQGRDIDAAMGIAVLGDRVIVSAYENVFVFTDADGDDRPEKKEVLFQFADKDHDHSVHAFVFGPDGRLYFNMGNEGDFVKDAAGNVVVDRAGTRVTEEGTPYREGMVFRVEPDGSNFEVLGHNFRNPYEAAVDAFGTIWQSDNDDDGNRGTRINYVMEYGNFGYKDEMTGASWPTRRTGMEEEIPLRHWHLNDPGVVPNVLQTGAGSPSGMTVYEAELLPRPIRGAMIHADPGQNVVRAYPVEREGAGYRGEVVDIVKGVGDPFFRPVDVAVAPDGSLFVADWYDPGVGGHDVGDRTQGRILRIAPRGMGYHPPAAPKLDTPAAAIAALRSPNLATRYLAYERLRGWGRGAEEALQGMWRSEDPRERARALWLLAQIEGRGNRYIDAALTDADPDIRITGVRAARRVGRDVIPVARRLARDPSPQVRRELLLALRHNTAPEAAGLWSELALQHDGRDRWYLEALGIAADRQWDRFFADWRQRVGEGWRSPAGRDIVWRARTDAAVPLLAQLIRDPATRGAERLRYFRALDFHPREAREQLLLGLLGGAHPDQEEITSVVVSQLDARAMAASPSLQDAVERRLRAARGTPEFVELVERYEMRDRVGELMQLALDDPQSPVAVQAARLVLRWEGVDRFRRLLDDGDPDAGWRALTVLGRAGGGAVEKLLEEVALDRSRPLAVRHAAIRFWGSTWSGGPAVLRLVEQGRLPDDLRQTAAEVLFGSFRRNVREGAAKHLQPPAATTAEGRALAPVDELVLRDGEAQRGRVVFAAVCGSCHVAGEQGREFGPALSEIGDKLSRQALYTSILHPSAGISFGYEGDVLQLRDGSEAVGIVASETADELVLRRPGGVATTYRKSEVAGRTRLESSLMPHGLASAMTEQQLVDLVEYLGTLKK
jgi:putative membrane-bound dehydrogenase-like protein